MDKVLLVVGTLVMAVNLGYALRLRRSAPGGIVGERLLQLTLFIGAFFIGYLAVGVLTLGRSTDMLLIILALILAGGAIFVWLVLRLVQAILAVIEG